MWYRPRAERKHLSRKTALLALPIAALLGGASAPAESSTVTVRVTELRNAKGIVRACMTTDAARFPKCRGVPGAYGATAQAQAGSVSFTFNGVKPGRYAVALLHDENSNGKADRALGMMPKEGFGFSRDAAVRMGPPKFSDAVVDIGGEDRTLTIRMRYML